jgi:lysophospholipase L1-like esterase
MISYLALGDSYTIGEGVSLHESFPYQAIQLLRKKGFPFAAPEIVAKTGWATDELQSHLQQTILQPPYDFVSLLIGVNNQYRQQSIDEYATQFESLVQTSARLVGNNPACVFVLSIPDWSVSPYAAGRDKSKIANQIDRFNEVNKQISHQHNAIYIDITASSREAAHDVSLIASDELHPSAKEYGRWAAKLANGFLQSL